MKILFLSDSLSKGGKERRMIELIKGLRASTDLQIALVLFKDSIEYPEVHTLRIPIHIIERKPKYNPASLIKFNRICKEFKPDIIHAWSGMTAILGLPWVLSHKTKLLNGSIANAPENISPWDKKLLMARLSYPFSNVIVSNSKAGLEAFKVPFSKSLCIPNGFDFNRTKGIGDKESTRAKYKITSRYVIGKIAGFADRKDYTTFLKTALLLLEVRSDITFLAVGDGPNLEKLKEMVPSEFRDKVIFTGAVQGVESLINTFDIGVLATNNEVHGEGISNAIMEYMAFGKPVIATAGGGTHEIIVDGETGFIITPKSPEDLYKKIIYLLDNPEKVKYMGEAGRKRILENFTLKQMTSQYQQLYNRMLLDNHQA